MLKNVESARFTRADANLDVLDRLLLRRFAGKARRGEAKALSLNLAKVLSPGYQASGTGGTDSPSLRRTAVATSCWPRPSPTPKTRTYGQEGSSLVDIALSEMVEKDRDTLMVRRAKKAAKTQARERSCGRLNAPADGQVHPAHVKTRPQAPRGGNTISHRYDRPDENGAGGRQSMTTDSSGSTGPVTDVLVSQMPPHYLQRGGGDTYWLSAQA
jgi:hypothetical protein